MHQQLAYYASSAGLLAYYVSAGSLLCISSWLTMPQQLSYYASAVGLLCISSWLTCISGMSLHLYYIIIYFISITICPAFGSPVVRWDRGSGLIEEYIAGDTTSYCLFTNLFAMVCLVFFLYSEITFPLIILTATRRGW
jgi:hypothetical protein